MVDDSQLAPAHPAYPLRTRRLALRPLTVRDIDALLAYRADVEVCRYLPFEPMTRADLHRHLASRWAGTWLTDEGQELRLGVELSSTGELIGDAVLFWRSREHRSGEVGYVLHPGFRGHGYATEAARGVLGLGFDVLGLHRIVARIDERNEASARTARRLGMRRESRIAPKEMFKGDWRTRLEFTMLSDDWRAAGTDDRGPVHGLAG